MRLFLTAFAIKVSGMSVESAWEHFFKPEVRKRGREDFAKGLAVMSIGGDTQIQGYVKATPLAKVSFNADDISSPTFTVDCSCSSAAKGALCKHIWAMLLVVEQKHPDFLDSKKSFEKVTKFAATESPFKAKQDEYKKQQYQKQKARAKEQRLQKKNQDKAPAASKYPEEVVQALVFFSSNGFPLEGSLNEESLKAAKKILARVFHPDKGGTHDESVVLNRNYEVLIRFIS